jgi:hypothetical protein
MTQAKTRIVHLAAGQRRKEAENAKTCVLMFDQSFTADSFRALFLANYTAIRHECTAFSQPGLAIFAIDVLTGAMVGSMCLAAKVDMPNSAIAGRHGMADLYLEGDASLSLRHLAIIASPLTSIDSHDIRFRIVDLRTSTAFQDEFGQQFEALLAEGPLFVRCGNYALFCLPTGDPTGWPPKAEDGWECIPERVYIQGEAAEPDRWQRQRPSPGVKPAGHSDAAKGDDDGDKDHNQAGHSESEAGGQPAEQDRRSAKTLVRSVAGPVRARLLKAGEEPLGTLRISAEVGVQSLVIGRRAAQQGVLLGRYERCDIDGVNVLTHRRISRVHLLVIEIEGRLYAVDTASTHGTWLGKESREVRITRMEAGTQLVLGQDFATLRWSPE